MEKFDNLIQRLTNKVKLSATPVTGFVLGLSGTDSIVTYILLNEVAKTEGFEIQGVHYSTYPYPNKPNFFRDEIQPWLLNLGYKTARATLIPNELAELDTLRWAMLHEKALHSRFWVASTVNATEKALGTFSIMANSASIAPIISLYKSEVLEICKEFNVPEKIINASRIPDCICGRDEFAAENIELIDLLLSNKYVGGYTDEQLIKAYDYIRETKKENDFKNRTPYYV